MWWLCQLNLSISNAGLSHAAYLRGSGSDSRKKAALNDAQTHTHTTKKEGVSWAQREGGSKAPINMQKRVLCAE